MMANFNCIDDRGLNQKSGSFLQIYERLLYGILIVLILISTGSRCFITNRYQLNLKNNIQG